MPGTLVFLSVNLLNIWSPIVALSVRADWLFWELCFIVFGIFLSPHMIATFPSLLYLFCHPPYSKNSKEGGLTSWFWPTSYCDTWKAFCDYHSGALEAAYQVFGAWWEKRNRVWSRKFAQLPFLICASMRCVCVVPISTRKQRLTAVMHVIHCMRIIRNLSQQMFSLHSCSLTRLMKKRKIKVLSDRRDDIWALMQRLRVNDDSWVRNCLILFFHTVTW